MHRIGSRFFLLFTAAGFVGVLSLPSSVLARSERPGQRGRDCRRFGLVHPRLTDWFSSVLPLDLCICVPRVVNMSIVEYYRRTYFHTRGTASRSVKYICDCYQLKWAPALLPAPLPLFLFLLLFLLRRRRRLHPRCRFISTPSEVVLPALVLVVRQGGFTFLRSRRRSCTIVRRRRRVATHETGHEKSVRRVLPGRATYERRSLSYYQPSHKSYRPHVRESR